MLAVWLGSRGDIKYRGDELADRIEVAARVQ